MVYDKLIAQEPTPEGDTPETPETETPTGFVSQEDTPEEGTETPEEGTETPEEGTETPKEGAEDEEKTE